MTGDRPDKKLVSPQDPPAGTEVNEKNTGLFKDLKLWLDIGKFVIGTVLLGVFTTMINAEIQDKEIELEKLKADQVHLSQFIDQAMSDRLIDRIRFAQYFAALSLSEESRARWQNYYKQLDDERITKEERLAVLYGALPDERERATNTGNHEKMDSLLREKQDLENDVGLIASELSSQEEFWNEAKLNSRIVDEAVFTWRQAIAPQGNVRIPTSEEAVRNIEEMAIKLQSIQDSLGKPIDIVSWYRPPNPNRAVGGARSTTHETGSGVVIKVPGFTAKELAEELSDWPGGMGLSPKSSDELHLDNRSSRVRWGGLE